MVFFLESSCDGRPFTIQPIHWRRSYVVTLQYLVEEPTENDGLDRVSWIGKWEIRDFGVIHTVVGGF